ncbi:hypothetical protein C6501_19830 [Candidatus Poribacteria bacterium]|nr:MAG: hypothetical protein C6501_19830 [Candidatus Poribacteria bacterium]
MKKTCTDKGNISRTFTRRGFLSTGLKAGAAAFTTGLLPNLRAETAGRYNVLFIMADDLRPLLGCYGHTEMHTPNIDALANRGTLFNRAYCQFPVCNPSRSSILTGLRPDTIGVHDNNTYFRNILPNAVTLPQHFKVHGYHTQSIGKIAHGLASLFDQLSWSVPIWRKWSTPPHTKTIPSWSALDVADHELRDGQTADKAIEVLEVLAEFPNTPFFLAVGFYKPHLPYNVPRRYYDLYDSVTFNIHTDSMTPKGAPRIARTIWNEIKNYHDFPIGVTSISDEKILEFTRAYAASTSYIDVLVGRVLQQLDTLGLAETTIIVLVGDHGYHLGEHGTWSKNTLFEVALRAPLIISVPGQQSNRTDALIELVDIYPTLCDACRLPIPSQLEGVSLSPVIEQPTRPWKAAAFSQLKRGNINGASIRTEQYRYTEWGTDSRHGRELYDYHADPNETENIANFPENKELVAQLSEQLQLGWQAALPDVSKPIPTPQVLPWDINNDGIVDLQDLVLISNNFGAEIPDNPKVDVNKDGSVDIIDLLIVAAHLGESTNMATPPTHTNILPIHLNLLDKRLTEAHLMNDGSDVFKQGIEKLEDLLNVVVPEKTTLLPNYPNPFNPETWIPYDLAQDTNVNIDIYNLKGEIIRKLDIGFQVAGTYRTQSRAAYWDGQNAVGERVASGVYLYTLQAGKFNSTRRMVILK